MASVNKAIIVGSLGKDPTLRYSKNSSAMCNISVATSRQWKDRNTGERQEETTWHSIVFYDRLAEVAGEYLKKGSSCYVEGRLRTRKWQDKEGIDRYTTEIIAESLQLLGSRQEVQQASQTNQTNEYEQVKGGRSRNESSNRINPDDPEWDIPF